MAVAHLALDLGPGYQRCHTVDNDDVHGAGADQRLGDLQRLLTGVRLADVEVVNVHADLAGVDRIHGVLNINEAADAALFLGFGNYMQTEGRLARTLRAIDFDDSALGHASDAECDVDTEAAGWNCFDLQTGGIAQLHDDTIAELLVQVAEGGL